MRSTSLLFVFLSSGFPPSMAGAGLELQDAPIIHSMEHDAFASLLQINSRKKDPEPWTIVWQDLNNWVMDKKPLTGCELARMGLPVFLWLIFGSCFVYGFAKLVGPRGSKEAILGMSIFAVFFENLLYSSVFVDSLDFASSVFGDQSKSGTIIGIHKMGTGVGTLLVFLLFSRNPTVWQTHGYEFFVGAFALQVLAALSFGFLSLLHVYSDLGGDVYFTSIYLSRFLQGLAGGIQVACGLEQSAFLKKGLQRSIHNTRFYLGGCLGMGFGPLLSSLSTATAHCVHCRELAGYEVTFAVCAIIPLMQLPALVRLPKKMMFEGDQIEGSPEESAEYPTQKALVISCCMALQILRSLSMASIEAALSELLYTEYHWGRRVTGIVTAVLMFSMLPAQIAYESLALRFSVNRAIRFLLLVALCGSGLNLCGDVFSLLLSAIIVLPSLALSSGLIMGTMQIHCIPNSYIFDLTGCTLFSLLLSDFLGRGLGPQFARMSIARGGQHAFGEQQLLISSVCVVVFELVHVFQLAKVNSSGNLKHSQLSRQTSPEADNRTDSGTQCD